MKNRIWLAIVAFGFMLLAACGSGGDSSSPVSTGRINVGLTDASTADYQAVYVTVKQMEVQKSDSSEWDVISRPNKTYNLLELINGVRETLALANLTAGHYGQMRLILADTPDNSVNILSVKHPYANYFINQDDDSIELKVPSGLQTGIKMVKGFDIRVGLTTELLLDFDVSRSIVKAGNSGKWLLKPTIKMLATKECSIIQGNAGAEGVLVSAQIYNGSAVIADGVEVVAATISDADGNYKLFLVPGTYALVGYKDEFATYCKNAKIVTAEGATYTENFAIGSKVSVGVLTGGVNISGADDEPYATFSIRQNVKFGGSDEKIEVKSFSVANGGTFSTSLPVKDYSAVISTYGKTTIERLFSIVSGLTTELGTIDF